MMSVDDRGGEEVDAASGDLHRVPAGNSAGSAWVEPTTSAATSS